MDQNSEADSSLNFMKLDLTKAAGQPVVLLQSGEGSLVSQGLQALLKEHTPEGEPLEHDLYSGDSSSPLDWVGAAGVVPFLTETRIVVVRNVGRCNPSKHWDAKATKNHPFVKDLASLPDTARLILVGDEEGGSQERKQTAQDQVERWAKLVGYAGGSVFKLDLTPEETARALIERAKSFEKSLAKPVAEKLSQMLGGQAGLALAEVDKLALYVGDGKAISEEAVDKLVIPELDYNIFQLSDGVFRGDSAFALKQFQLLKTRITDMQTEALSRVLPMMHRHLKIAWQARICLEAKCRPADPPDRVRALFPDKPLITTEKDWLQRKHMEAARGLDFNKLSLCLAELAQADQKLKGILPSFKAEETIETMILTMAHICRDSARMRV